MTSDDRRRSPPSLVALSLAVAPLARRAQPPQQPVVPRRRRPRLAERHGHRRARRATSPISTQTDFQVFEDGVKQDVTFFNRDQPADRAVAAHRHQREHGDAAARPRRRRRSASRGRLRPQDLAEVVDFDSRVVILQPFTNDVGRARAGDPRDVGRRLDLAVQRDLHRAEGPEEGRRHERRGRSAARRSSCCRTARTRRACCRSRKCSISRSGPRRRSTRSACASSDGGRRAGLQGGRVRAAAARAGDRRPRVLPERRSPSCRRSTARSPTSCRASTRSATPRRTRGATAPGAAIVVRVARPNTHRAHQAGLLRADRLASDP